MEHGCRKGDVVPNQKNNNMLQIQSLKVREVTTASSWLQPHCLHRGSNQRSWDKACVSDLGILRPTAVLVQQPLGGRENQRLPPSWVKRLPLWQQNERQKSARAWVIHRLKSSLSSLVKGLTHGQRLLQHVQVTLLSKGREQPLH